MAQSSLVVLVSAGEVLETGIWCPACLLPSGVSFEFFVTTEHGSGRHVGRWCVAHQGVIHD